MIKGQEFTITVKFKFQNAGINKVSPVAKNLVSKYSSEKGFVPACPNAKNTELLLYYDIKGNGNVDEAIQDLSETGFFSYIQKDEIVYTTCSAPSVPNDYLNKYYFDLIQAQCAWSITKGSPDILIGIADTDFDINHDDLRNQIVYIGGEISGGANHGTLVAGVAAAETNNNLGIASIGYNSKIAAQRIKHTATDTGNFANTTDIRNAIWTLYQMHVPIINASWGGTGLTADMAREITGNGTVIVVSAGNTVKSRDSIGKIQYPPHAEIGNVPGVIIVAGSDENDNHIPRYHHNRFVDLCAPAYWYYTTNINNSYVDNVGGSSLSAPLVSGTIALMLSANPHLTPAQIESILKATADPIFNAADFPGLVGAGRLNAYKAVKAIPPDLMIRDNLADTGAEPNNIEDCWSSPDIWVRNSNDNGLDMQNPEYKPTSPNWVYVRVTNRGGNYPGGTANLKLYWAKASTALLWDYHWRGEPYPNGNGALLGNYVGTLPIPAMQHGEERIIKFPWIVPNPALYSSINSEPWHFCLLARIVSDEDPMTFPEVEFLPTNTTNNNNIAWRNTTVVDLEYNTISGTVAVSNIYPHSHNYDLIFSASAHETGKKIFEEAEINIALDKTILDSKVRGGKPGKNIKQKDERTVTVTGQNAVLENLTLAPNETGTINLRFNFITKEITDKQDYSYSVILRDAVTKKIIGGENYIITKKRRTLFFADAGDEKIVDKNEPFTLNAALINEPAIYNWYDANENLIYKGADFTTAVEIGKKFKLEVIALTDGYKDYAEVEVKLKPNSLKEIYPNPASSVVNIDYSITEAHTAYISIMNYYNPQLSSNFILNTSDNNLSFPIQHFPSGIYVVTLICDGKVADSKFLIKQ
ncbi:hypothetical protein FACS1894180_4380 [Bacteroidia bacterium]|nr:hypothetical protein FACS1894180_4380 [Bacteroidia bacterium]